MSTRRLLVLLVGGATLLGSAAGARAHGGSPVSQRILHHGSTLYVPVEYWGVWVGDGVSPWQWICEEEINSNKSRRLVVASDGTFYATSYQGVTVSTDRGCTWTDVGGADLSQVRSSDVAVDPVDGKTAYVTTAQATVMVDGGASVPAKNGLFITHDDGAHFALAPGLSDPNRLYQSVLAAPQTIYVTSNVINGPRDPAIHRSVDGGLTFSITHVPYLIEGNAPASLDLLAIDPRDASVLYVRAFIEIVSDAGDPIYRHALLRSSDGGATFAEILQITGVTTPSGQSRGIDGVAIDAARGVVLVATANGLLSASDQGGGAPLGALSPTGNLSQAQCVDVSGTTTLACSSNFAPDNAAIARSDDGAQTFHSILHYVDTQGPVTYCAATTPVGANCPLLWQMYGFQLGQPTLDLGAEPDHGPPSAINPSGCEFGGSGRTAGLYLAMVLAALVSAIRFARRAPRRG